jgi:hypothetical protein
VYTVEDRLSVLEPGNGGGLGGTSLPSTKFNFEIASVTVVDVVSVTALLTNAGAELAPNTIVLPIKLLTLELIEAILRLAYVSNAPTLAFSVLKLFVCVDKLALA